MPDRNLVELIAAMDILSTNLKARLPEIPLLEPLQTDLDAWLAETRGLENQQEIYTARLRETNEKRRKAEARGIAARPGRRGPTRPVRHQEQGAPRVRPQAARRAPHGEEGDPAGGAAGQSRVELAAAAGRVSEAARPPSAPSAASPTESGRFPAGLSDRRTVRAAVSGGGSFERFALLILALRAPLDRVLC